MRLFARYTTGVPKCCSQCVKPLDRFFIQEFERVVVCTGVGTALAKADRLLIFGGGRKGLMGVVSGAALEAGGSVTGVIPYAMVVSGGEREQTAGEAKSKAAAEALFDGQNRKNVRRRSLVRDRQNAHVHLRRQL